VFNLKQGSPPVAGDATRPSELPQENQDVLKKVARDEIGCSHWPYTFYLYCPTWGKILSHDCDRRNRLCVSSNMSGSDQSRRPFAWISEKVSLEDFHHSFRWR
jgi:hypothetical protein